MGSVASVEAVHPRVSSMLLAGQMSVWVAEQRSHVMVERCREEHPTVAAVVLSRSGSRCARG